jgi:hypothetical protein
MNDKYKDTFISSSASRSSYWIAYKNANNSNDIDPTAADKAIVRWDYDDIEGEDLPLVSVLLKLSLVEEKEE